MGGIIYSDIGFATQTIVFNVLDLGQFTIQPTLNVKASDSIDTLSIYIESISDQDTSYSLEELYDIILIPADEWSGNFGTTLDAYAHGGAGFGQGYDVDGITVPKQYRAISTNISPSTPQPYTTYDDQYRSVYGNLTRISPSEPILINNADQRLWFFQYQQYTRSKRSYFENCGKICMQRSNRYIFMRGNA
jgi:hypothetical protein